MSADLQKIADIAEIPLRHLERRFSELSAAMSNASEHSEDEAHEARTPEAVLAGAVKMSYQKGVASALEVASDAISEARQVLSEAVAEMEARS